MQRRDLLLSAFGPCLATLPSWASEPSSELTKVWRRERGVLMIRHAVTESGIGDPPGFVLGQCQTQRNLSDEGRQASRSIGQWMRVNQFAPERENAVEFMTIGNHTDTCLGGGLSRITLC